MHSPHAPRSADRHAHDTTHTRTPATISRRRQRQQDLWAFSLRAGDARATARTFAVGIECCRKTEAPARRWRGTPNNKAHTAHSQRCLCRHVNRPRLPPPPAHPHTPDTIAVPLAAFLNACRGGVSCCSAPPHSHTTFDPQSNPPYQQQLRATPLLLAAGALIQSPPEAASSNSTLVLARYSTRRHHHAPLTAPTTTYHNHHQPASQPHNVAPLLPHALHVLAPWRSQALLPRAAGVARELRAPDLPRRAPAAAAAVAAPLTRCLHCCDTVRRRSPLHSSITHISSVNLKHVLLRVWATRFLLPFCIRAPCARPRAAARPYSAGQQARTSTTVPYHRNHK